MKDKMIKLLDDTKFVAVLIAKGYQPKAVFNDNGIIKFEFEWDAITEEHEKNFYNYELSVDALKYAKALRDVKKEYIHEKKDSWR